MDERRFAQIRDVFHAACELEPVARRQYINTVCAGDPALRDEVNALFDIEAASSEQRFAAPTSASLFLKQFDLSASPPLTTAPQQIGAFRIIQMLGEGSMGIVYLAEQEHPRRVVALKVLRTWDYSSVRLQRFHREIDLLARLQHPGIARVYEAGVGDAHTATGGIGRVPYLALERIEGDRLLEYCQKQKLDRTERLELIAAIADAVHHAHCRGVIHRDLKPSNILVDAAHQPKILDFGLSRATDAGPDASLRTEAGQILGTIAYASPEQLRGDADAVDARSDVYSIGVMLFEMLTGSLPIDVRGLDLPSAVARVAHAEPAAASRLDGALRGDLDAILSKALEKDPQRRYSSAAELAADIRRHLNEEPIAARPITTAVTLHKALRRHRVTVAAAAIALIGTIGGLSFGLIEARSQRDAARAAESRAIDAGNAEKTAREAAQRDARIAAAVAEFMNQDLFGATGHGRNPSRDMPLGEVLDAAAMRIDGKFPDEPLVEAATRGTLGLSYLKLGDYIAAEPQIRRAYELRAAHLPAGDPALFEIRSLFAHLQCRLGRLDEGVQHYEAMVKEAAANPAISTAARGNAQSGLGWARMHLGQFAESEPMLRDAIETIRSAGTDPLELVRALTNLGMCLLRMKRYPEAESTLNEAVDLARTHGVEENADALNASGALAAMLNEQGKFDEAVPLLTAHLEKQSRILGQEHPQTLITQSNIAFSYLQSNRLDDAEPIILATQQTRERLLGEAHPHTLHSLQQLAVLRHKQQRLPEAEALFRRGVELTRENPAISKRIRNDWLTQLANVVEAQGRSEEAAEHRATID